MKRPFAWALGAVLAASLAPACGSPDPDFCTPSSSGFGDATVLERIELHESPTPGTSCNGHVEVVHSDEELRRALQAAKVAVIADDGTSPGPDAIELPRPDYTKEAVVLRERLTLQLVKWLVGKDGVVTLGTQGCAGEEVAECKVSLYVVPASTTRVDEHVCEAVSCNVPTNTE